MIERIYLDNIRTFVNFEWRPGPVALLLGPNGSGKSCLMVVLLDLMAFLRGDTSIEVAFGGDSLTRWQAEVAKLQIIELDVRGNGGLYRYRAVIQSPEEDPGPPVLLQESLSFEGRQLIEFDSGKVRSYSDQGGVALEFPGRDNRSTIGSFPAGSKQKIVPWFHRWVSQAMVLRPDPRRMSVDVKQQEGRRLRSDIVNFASWYVGAMSSSPGNIFKAVQALSEVLPGFSELFVQSGQMYARFDCEGHSSVFLLDELSEGQIELIALYVLRHTQTAPGQLLAIDEPDNYVSLREVQPWVSEMVELALAKNGPQIWLISHHPEILNLLAAEYGWRFFREQNGKTRVERFTPAGGLAAAETIARGWDDAG